MLFGIISFRQSSEWVGNGGLGKLNLERAYILDAMIVKQLRTLGKRRVGEGELESSKHRCRVRVALESRRRVFSCLSESCLYLSVILD